MIADLRALGTHRQLLQDFAWRELRSRYKGSFLGFGWNFAIPLLQLGVYWILFGVIFGSRPQTASGPKEFPIFLFVGLMPWTFFANSLSQGAAAIVANGAIVKKVRLPVQLLPAASVLSALANFLLSMIVVLVVLLMAWYFLTPILFSVALVADRQTELFLLYLNPMSAIIVSYQRAFLDGLPPEWGRLAYSAVFAAVVFVGGFAYFRHAKDEFEEAL